MSADPFLLRRQRMVETIRRRGVIDRAVCHAMGQVPREEFVPDWLREEAYDDCALPLAHGQTISQPHLVALMTEALRLEPGDRVLEIGTGSGYSAAILSLLAAEVVSIERDPDLATSAADRLRKLGYDNVEVHCGDGTLGWPELAPYDAIVVTAGGPKVPPALLEQLAIGGRLVIPIGSDKSDQTLFRITKLGVEDYRQEPLCEVRFVPLVGTAGWESGD
jgi:protein-L-isoaspartate(D-aspartate) O-methyltransferase